MTQEQTKNLYPEDLKMADVYVDWFRGGYRWAIYLCGWDNAEHGQAADYTSDDDPPYPAKDIAEMAGQLVLLKLKIEAFYNHNQRLEKELLQKNKLLEDYQIASGIPQIDLRCIRCGEVIKRIYQGHIVCCHTEVD